MSPKELIKLAAACRKAGITHYKQGDVEFTLTLDPPEKPSKKAPSGRLNVDDNESFTSDELTEEQLLYYSVGTYEEPTDKQIGE